MPRALDWQLPPVCSFPTFITEDEDARAQCNDCHASTIYTVRRCLLIGARATEPIHFSQRFIHVTLAGFMPYMGNFLFNLLNSPRSIVLLHFIQARFSSTNQ